ncbi:MAG TPA: hypothetical protein VMU95_39740 [Trebonia sp.]|nr:hypothetical protein [Trebonia sp.]
MNIVSAIDARSLCLDAYADAIGRVDNGACNNTNAQVWSFSSDNTISNVNGSMLAASSPSSSSLGSVSTLNTFGLSFPGLNWTIAQNWDIYLTGG